MTEETILGTQTTPTSTTPTPLPNDSAARTSDGTIIDRSASPVEPDTSSVVETPPAEPVVPETYDFKFPEGLGVDKKILDEYIPLFKEMKLDQTSAQKLVDTYTKNVAAQNAALLKAVEDTRAKFVEQTKSDPYLGPRLETVRIDVNRALAHLDPKVVTDFKSALDFTGGGDHPAIIRAIYDLSKLINEGTHISGRGPSPDGQAAAGKVTPPSAASALYPNLPTASR